MSLQILDGKVVAHSHHQQLIDQLKTLPPLKMGILVVGDNAASINYIKRKQKVADLVGVTVDLKQLPHQSTTQHAIDQVNNWNDDPAVTGCIVQLPLPKHIDQAAILDCICPYKDIDGLNPWSLGKLLIGQPLLVPATARGVVALLEYYHIPIQGRHIVIVGRSLLVGKPLGLLLLQHNATVIFAHRQTVNLATITKQADIVISAAGQSNLITSNHIKSGAVVIDVGITQTEHGLTGDVDRASVDPIASAISPVPGGVGPLTVACLFENLVAAYHLQQAHPIPEKFQPLTR